MLNRLHYARVFFINLTYWLTMATAAGAQNTFSIISHNMAGPNANAFEYTIQKRSITETDGIESMMAQASRFGLDVYGVWNKHFDLTLDAFIKQYAHTVFKDEDAYTRLTDDLQLSDVLSQEHIQTMQRGAILQQQ